MSNGAIVIEQKAEPQSARSSLRDKYRSARLIGLCVATAVFIISEVLNVGLGWGQRAFVLIALAAGRWAIWSVVAGVLAFVGLAVWWTWEHATRDWRLENEDRRLEQQRANWELVKLRQEIEKEIGNPADPESNRLDAVAYALLARHYAGRPTTRAECVSDGLCTQPEWNTVNAAFKMLGWKDKNTLTPPGSERLAQLVWGQRTEVWDDGALWVMDGRYKLRKAG